MHQGLIQKEKCQYEFYGRSVDPMKNLKAFSADDFDESFKKSELYETLGYGRGHYQFQNAILILN